MPQQTVYILHKNGADSHYTGLQFLLQKEDINLEYREFSVLSKLFKSLTKFNFKLFRKQLANAAFMISLLFSKDKKIVLGIAPFDSKLGGLLNYLKKHQVYYHTSWTFWDKSFHPKTKKNSPKVFKTWKQFLEEKVSHIFAVTHQSKSQLLENYTLKDSKISVVYHAIDKAFTTKITPKRKRQSFVYLGRLVPQKGIEEILDFFAKNEKCSLTVIGKGPQQNLVEDHASSYKNITYLKHTSNKTILAELLSTHEYVLLNSKRNKKWEELFGLIIIESMAQGLISIAPDHSGPKEIISEDIGYIFNEGNLKDTLDHVTSLNVFDKTMSEAAKKKSVFYLPENIAKHWQAILE
ncbi:glycosyltransferase family 4 protein [uncultured Psychroserpens sp.]|uniref:glycosyltransferase family 4 protein n=1 Tax=uncultured Psychroserpens sp. TaxID=255436 RepID=UPI00260C28FB|nr:glycosyltransferase family 4 protein [uncultured Psychroserpens sp.]